MELQLEQKNREAEILTRDVTRETNSLSAKFLSGSFVLLTGSGLVSGINFAYNIAIARFLGPGGFGHATAVYTLLILVSAVTLSFQIVSAKLIAKQGLLLARSAVYHSFHRDAWAGGVIAALLLILCQNIISSYLNLPSSNLVVLLAVGVAFYVPLGTRRGYLQGTCAFRHLATNLVLEGFMRLCGSLLLVLLGFGVTGVIVANAAAIGAAYFFAAPRVLVKTTHTVEIPDGFREALQAIVFFVGQVVINNCDIVLVKHFFPPTPAGLYAAVALVGRVVFAFSWAIVNTMFPIVAGTDSRQRKEQGVLSASLLMVFSIGAVFTIGLRLAPSGIWRMLFGSQFVLAGHYGFASLLALYAATTAVYSLSVVIIAYEMSHKIANTRWVQLAFSSIVIAGIYRYHSSLQRVIWVQLVLMLVLLIVVSLPFIARALIVAEEAAGGFPGRNIRKIRHVTEDEVIAEFLRNDFHSPEFRDYQLAMSRIVMTPDLSDAAENAKRRALFLIRHGSLWRELPQKTEWFEVQIQEADLHQIRVFPRAQWRKLARREDFSILHIRRCLASDRCFELAEESFLSKMRNVRHWIEQDITPGAVLLIGVSESGPFTILDGNHRLVAATLARPEAMKRFRFYCGLSPQMPRCCWYQTTLATLIHYGLNQLKYLTHHPEAELEHLLESS